VTTVGDVIPFPDVGRIDRCPCGWRTPVMRTYAVTVDVLGVTRSGDNVVGFRRDTMEFRIGYACPECGTMFTSTFGGEVD